MAWTDRDWSHPAPPRLTPPGGAVRGLLIATAAITLLQWLVDGRTRGAFSQLFGLSRPALLAGYVWQPITYLFLHGGLWHALINLATLFFFGRELEQGIGTRRMLGLYFASGIFAGLGWMLLSGHAAALCIGASGAVFGLAGAFAALYPHRRITLLIFFVLPVTMSARTMALGIALISVFALMGDDGNVAHSAHLAGGVIGYAYGTLLARRGIGSAAWPATWRRRTGLVPWLAARLARRRRGNTDAWPPIPRPSAGEVDRILDKITRSGLGSLTRAERDALDRASRE